MLPQSSSCSYIVFYNQMKFINYVIIFKQNKENNNTMLLICVGRHYAQTNTKNVNKTRALLQTIGGKDEPNIVFMIYEV
jgi:hypothetical protein